MSNFTYQAKSYDKYEYFEWDNTWIDHISDKDAKRILYIGDSISCGLRLVATEIAEEKIRFDGFGTSKALDNPYFKDSLRLFAAQQEKRDAVLFNNGLHGWHLEDETDYKSYLEDMLLFLKTEFSKIPFAFVLTTCIADCENTKRVKVRNRVMRELAEKHGVSIIDLFEISKENQHLLRDGVHFNDEGCKILAQKLVTEVKKLIEA